MLTRREFGALGLALAGSAASQELVSRINGVLIGIQSWSFRDRTLDEAIKATRRLGAGSWELGSNHLEPAELSREELRKWRLTVPLEELRKARRKFDANGISLTGYSLSIGKDFTEEEIARGFEMTKALSLDLLTTSTNVSLAPLLDRFAQKTRTRVGFHNHSRILRDEFATPDDFAAALDGRSRHIGINLDVGHFFAAGFDPVSYIEKHHARIWSIHLKDRKKNQGPSCLFGQGDTPVREILLLLKKNRYDIPSMIEWEGSDPDSVTAVGECIAYCRRVLA